MSPDPRSRSVFCARLKREAEGLDARPWPGALGQRIFDEISKQAWADWLAHQTMLLNENRLSAIDPKARAFLAAEMEKFLFAGTAEKPPGFVPQSE